MKSILKRIIVGVVIGIILMLIKTSNIFAYQIYSNDNITIDEKFIYNELNKITGFDINTHHYIYCNYNIATSNSFSCAAYDYGYLSTMRFNQSFSSMGKYYFRYGNGTIYTISISNLLSDEIVVNRSTYTATTSKDQSHEFNSSSNSSYKGFSNFNLKDFYDSWTYDDEVNKLDFSPYLEDPYLTINYLDSERKKISFKNCYEKDETCIFDINSSSGKYLQFIYDIKSTNVSWPSLEPAFKYVITPTITINGINKEISVVDGLVFYKYQPSDVVLEDSLYFIVFNENKKLNNNNYEYTFSFNYDKSDISTGTRVYSFWFNFDVSDLDLTTISTFNKINLDVEYSSGSGGGEVTPPEEKDPMEDTNNKLDDMNDKLDDLNTNITDSNVDVNGDFFTNFDDKDYGLSDIVKAPLGVINSITTGSCSDIDVTLPFVNKSLTIPCLMPIYQKYFLPILVLYQTVTGGVISYWICVQLLEMVKNFKDPDKDEIQVVDL